MSDKQWWEPVVRNEVNDWLCDHDGDWQEKCDKLWDRLSKAEAIIESARHFINLHKFSGGECHQLMAIEDLGSAIEKYKKEKQSS